MTFGFQRCISLQASRTSLKTRHGQGPRPSSYTTRTAPKVPGSTLAFHSASFTPFQISYSYTEPISATRTTMGDLSSVTLVIVERMLTVTFCLPLGHMTFAYQLLAKIVSRALELLPLSHQDMLRDECVAILNGTVAATDPVLSPFVNKDTTTNTFKCVLHEQGQPCKYTRIKRLNRALAHVRRHLNLRAFRCSGACGKANW